MIRRLSISSSDPVWVRELKTWCNTVVDEVDRVRVRGDGTTTRVENGVVSASHGLPPITSESKRHMCLILELDEDMVAAQSLSEEDQWKALSYELGYKRLQ